MEFTYAKNDQETAITYGKTFVSQLRATTVKATHVFLITNQRYYDLFADKFIQFFDEGQEIDWFICKNDAHCNNMNELESLLTFIADFDQQQDFLFLGIGNEGVIQLTSFLHSTSVLTSTCWLLPLSVRALSKSLLADAEIELSNHPVLKNTVLPEQIIYDHTLITDHGDGKLVDFLIFIRCGIVRSHDYLRVLFKNYNDRSKLNQQSFAALLNEMIHYYEIDGQKIDQFGTLFEHGFSEAANGHLLSRNMKRLLGCLLQLLWAQKISGFSFHYKNFVIWLIHLGFPVDFPEQILTSDYVEGGLTCVDRGERALLLSEIGNGDQLEKPKAEDLIQTVEQYRRIINEIRGQNDDNI